MAGVRTRVDLRVDDVQREIWEDAARGEGLSLSAWIRLACTERATVPRFVREVWSKPPEPDVGSAGPVSRYFEGRDAGS